VRATAIGRGSSRRDRTGGDVVCLVVRERAPATGRLPGLRRRARGVPRHPRAQPGT